MPGYFRALAGIWKLNILHLKLNSIMKSLKTKWCNFCESVPASWQPIINYVINSLLVIYSIAFIYLYTRKDLIFFKPTWPKYFNINIIASTNSNMILMVRIRSFPAWRNINCINYSFCDCILYRRTPNKPKSNDK